MFCMWQACQPSAQFSSCSGVCGGAGTGLWFGCSRGAQGIPGGWRTKAHGAACRGRHRGVVPICLSANNQFLGHFLKSDLQGQKGISKTCISIHWTYIVNIFWEQADLLPWRNKRVALKGIHFYITCADFSAAFGTSRGVLERDGKGSPFQGMFKVLSKQAEQNLAVGYPCFGFRSLANPASNPREISEENQQLENQIFYTPMKTPDSGQAFIPTNLSLLCIKCTLYVQELF